MYSPTEKRMIKWESFLLVLFVLMVYLVLGGLFYHLIEKALPETCDMNFEWRLLLDKYPLNATNDTSTETYSSNIRMEIEETWKRCNGFYLNATEPKNLPFSDAMYLAMTVLTTIGYGHFVPHTWGGKLFTIFYGFFGIPLCFFNLVVIGEKMGRAFNFVLVKCNCIRGKRLRLFQKVIILVLVGQLVFFFLPSLIIQQIEQTWSYLDAYYFIFVTIATIGFGDLVAGKNAESGGIFSHAYRVSFYLWCLFGISYITLIIHTIVESLQKKSDQWEKNISEAIARRSHRFAEEPEIVEPKPKTRWSQRLGRCWNRKDKSPVPYDHAEQSEL